MRNGGKGLGRFTWLKAFERAQITSTFKDQATAVFCAEPSLLTRTTTWTNVVSRSQSESGEGGTTVHLVNFYEKYKSECPRTTEVLIEKIIEHFLLVLLEPSWPNFILLDQGQTYRVNEIFEKDYKADASTHTFKVSDVLFTLHGFRLPTSRTTKHKLVYAADQRAVISDNLEDYLPNRHHVSSTKEDRSSIMGSCRARI